MRGVFRRRTGVRGRRRARAGGGCGQAAGWTSGGGWKRGDAKDNTARVRVAGGQRRACACDGSEQYCDDSFSGRYTYPGQRVRGQATGQDRVHQQDARRSFRISTRIRPSPQDRAHGGDPVSRGEGWSSRVQEMCGVRGRKESSSSYQRCLQEEGDAVRGTNARLGVFHPTHDVRDVRLRRHQLCEKEGRGEEGEERGGVM